MITGPEMGRAAVACGVRKIRLTGGSCFVLSDGEPVRLSAPVQAEGKAWYAPAELLLRLGLSELDDPEANARYYTRIVRASMIPEGVRVPVLMYHAVSDAIWGVPELFVSPSRLEAQLQAMQERGFTAVTFEDKALPADVLLMENRSGIYAFVKEMAARGKSGIAFVGEALHCMSFYERYDAYMGALRLFSLPYRPEYCITGTSRGLDYPPHESYLAYLEESFRKWDKLPSVTICANDFVAMDVLHVFRKLGISVPDDMYLCGFDDSPESRLVSPALTTIRIHGKAMGREAIRLLFSRIKEPGLEFRTVYSGTTLLYRGSTGD